MQLCIDKHQVKISCLCKMCDWKTIVFVCSDSECWVTECQVCTRCREEIVCPSVCSFPCWGFLSLMPEVASPLALLKIELWANRGKNWGTAGELWRIKWSCSLWIQQRQLLCPVPESEMREHRREGAEWAQGEWKGWRTSLGRSPAVPQQLDRTG